VKCFIKASRATRVREKVRKSIDARLSFFGQVYGREIEAWREIKRRRAFNEKEKTITVPKMRAAVPGNERTIENHDEAREVLPVGGCGG